MAACAADCETVSGLQALPAKAPRPQSPGAGIPGVISSSAYLWQSVPQQWSPRVFPEGTAVGLRVPAASSGFADHTPGSAAQFQQNEVGPYSAETISHFSPEHAGLMPRP